MMAHFQGIQVESLNRWTDKKIIFEMIEKIKEQLLESGRIKSRFAEGSELGKLVDLVQNIRKALLAGNKVIFAGNGGSFSDALHLAAEFVGRYKSNRKPLAALALGGNGSSVTAIGNDFGYENVFVRELESLGRRGDVFIGLTTSGNSPNILHCVQKAKEMGILPYVLTGAKGGKAVQMCTCIHVPSDDVARIQECHITLGHILCDAFEEGI